MSTTLNRFQKNIRMPIYVLNNCFKIIHFLIGVAASFSNIKTCNNIMDLPVTNGIKLQSLYAFESLTSHTVFECAELCIRRTLCRSANFLSDKRMCELNSVIKTDDIVAVDDNAEYLQKDEMQAVSSIQSEL